MLLLLLPVLSGMEKLWLNFSTFGNNWILSTLVLSILFLLEQVVASANPTLGPGYKRLLKGEVDSASYLSTTVAFEGYLKYSALFYG